MPKFKKGVACPVAALAGKTECLGSDCGWFMPDNDPHCLIGTQSVTITMLIDQIELLSNEIEEIKKVINEGKG